MKHAGLGLGLALSLAACAAPALDDEEVALVSTPLAGGTVAKSAYPFYARVTSVDRATGIRLVCSGVLVAPLFVLTSAHCTGALDPGGAYVPFPPADVGIIIDRPTDDPAEGEDRVAQAIIVNPRLSFGPFVNGITVPAFDGVLLKLDRSSTRPPVDLASPYSPADGALTFPGLSARFVGKGENERFVEEITSYPIWDDEEYADWANVRGRQQIDPKIQFVAGFDGAGVGMEKGDMGGPLLARATSTSPWQLIGIASAAFSFDGRSPTIFTRVGGQSIHRWLRSVIHHTPLLGDVDGDHKADLITFTHGAASDVLVARSTGTAFKATVEKFHDWWAQDGVIPLVGNFNGDDKDDIFAVSDRSVWVALSDGTKFGQTFSIADVVDGSMIPRTGDVNGDRRADVVLFTTDGTGRVLVLHSTASGFAGPYEYARGLALEDTTPVVADVDRDGLADVVLFHQGLFDHRVEIARSYGILFASPTNAHSGFALPTQVPAVGRFDTFHPSLDIVLMTRDPARDVFVSSGTGTTFGTRTKWNDTFGGERSTLLAGDVTGDGFDDLVELTQDANQDAFVSRNTRSSSFAAPVKFHDQIAP